MNNHDSINQSLDSYTSAPYHQPLSSLNQNDPYQSFSQTPSPQSAKTSAKSSSKVWVLTGFVLIFILFTGTACSFLLEKISSLNEKPLENQTIITEAPSDLSVDSFPLPTAGQQGTRSIRDLSHLYASPTPAGENQSKAGVTPAPPTGSSNKAQDSAYASISNYKTPTTQVKKGSGGCPATMLKIGDYAYVNPPTGSTTMRTGPYGRLAGVEADKAYKGAIFEVTDGPVCDSGVNMFLLKTTWGTEYWAPEAPSDGSVWWLLPLTTRKACPDAMPSRLLVGMKAFVLEDPYDPVEVYKEPVLDQESIIYRIYPPEHDVNNSARQATEKFELIKGPHCDGKGANWWYVRLENGKEGWLRESSRAHDYYYVGPYFD